MQIEKYLKQYQPIIYETFLNSLNKKMLSHAYLLSGETGTPLLEIAQFLAKSILCDDPSPLACDSCITCLRVDDNNYPDYFLFDGSKSTIGKDNVISIENSFDKKAFEVKGIRIYILHLIENMTTEAINAILKFLEEPGKEIYAFLTTNNDSLILETIISRCQVFKIKSISRKDVILEAKELGVEQENAEILSYFYNSGELIFNLLKKDEDEELKDYLNFKKYYENMLDYLLEDNSYKTAYLFEKNIIPIIKDKQITRVFIDILIETFEDLLNIQNKCDIYLKSYENKLFSLANRLSHVKESLIELLKTRNLININVSNTLIIDHILHFILKEQI